MADLREEREKAEDFKGRIKEAMEPCLTRGQMLYVLNDLIEAEASEIGTDELANQMKTFVESGEVSMADR